MFCHHAVQREKDCVDTGGGKACFGTFTSTRGTFGNEREREKERRGERRKTKRKGKTRK